MKLEKKGFGYKFVLASRSTWKGYAICFCLGLTLGIVGLTIYVDSKTDKQGIDRVRAELDDISTQRAFGLHERVLEQERLENAIRGRYEALSRQQELRNEIRNDILSNIDWEVSVDVKELRGFIRYQVRLIGNLEGEVFLQRDLVKELEKKNEFLTAELLRVDRLAYNYELLGHDAIGMLEACERSKTVYKGWTKIGLPVLATVGVILGGVGGWYVKDGIDKAGF